MKFLFVCREVGIFKSRVTQTKSERPLALDISIVVIKTIHRRTVFTELVVVGIEAVHIFRICVRQLRAEVLLTAEKGRKRVSSIIAWKKN